MSLATIDELYGLVRDGCKCALSGIELTPQTAVADHKLARSQGGSDGIENLQVVHHTINRMKHTLTNEEFLVWCERVVNRSRSITGSYPAT